MSIDDNERDLEFIVNLRPWKELKSHIAESLYSKSTRTIRNPGDYECVGTYQGMLLYEMKHREEWRKDQEQIRRAHEVDQKAYYRPKDDDVITLGCSQKSPTTNLNTLVRLKSIVE